MTRQEFQRRQRLIALQSREWRYQDRNRAVMTHKQPLFSRKEAGEFIAMAFLFLAAIILLA